MLGRGLRQLNEEEETVRKAREIERPEKKADRLDNKEVGEREDTKDRKRS